MPLGRRFLLEDFSEVHMRYRMLLCIVLVSFSVRLLAICPLEQRNTPLSALQHTGTGTSTYLPVPA
jgi:hypothetical protein